MSFGEELALLGHNHPAVFTATAWVTLSGIWVAAALTDRLLDQGAIDAALTEVAR